MLEVAEVVPVTEAEGDLEGEGVPEEDIERLPEPVAEPVRSGDRVPDELPEEDLVPVEVLVEEVVPVEVLVKIDVHVLDGLPEPLFDTDIDPDAERVPTPERVSKGDAEEERVPNELLDI